MSAPPLSPEELDHLDAMAPEARAAWAVEEIARWEEAWILVDASGWVLFKMENAPAGQSPYALPLWPRQELAALAARDGGDQPLAISLEDMLEEVLPEVAERGWKLLPCPTATSSVVTEVDDLSQQLTEAWTALVDEEI